MGKCFALLIRTTNKIEEYVLLEIGALVLTKFQLSILPSQVSFNQLSIADTSIVIARREIFDIRTQLMAEDSAGHDNEELIAGIEHGDLKPNFYEGGFKTWECSLDLAKLVADDNTIIESPGSSETDVHIIEVGPVSITPFGIYCSPAPAWRGHCGAIYGYIRPGLEPNEDPGGLITETENTFHLCRLQCCRFATGHAPQSPPDLVQLSSTGGKASRGKSRSSTGPARRRNGYHPRVG